MKVALLAMFASKVVKSGHAINIALNNLLPHSTYADRLTKTVA